MRVHYNKSTQRGNARRGVFVSTIIFSTAPSRRNTKRHPVAVFIGKIIDKKGRKLTKYVKISRIVTKLKPQRTIDTTKKTRYTLV